MNFLKRLRYEFFPKPDAFDREHGTSTSGHFARIRMRGVVGDRKHAVAYEPSDPEWFRATVASLGINPREYTFVDLGCGKGRVLILAAELGFTAVVGVEFAASLAKIGRRNVGSLAKIVCQDAGEYRFPDGPLVVYMYNPFDASVLSRVAKNLRDLMPRDIFVCYVNSRHAHVLDCEPWLSRVVEKELATCYRSSWHDRRIMNPRDGTGRKGQFCKESG